MSKNDSVKTVCPVCGGEAEGTDFLSSGVMRCKFCDACIRVHPFRGSDSNARHPAMSVSAAKIVTNPIVHIPTVEIDPRTTAPVLNGFEDSREARTPSIGWDVGDVIDGAYEVRPVRDGDDEKPYHASGGMGKVL